MQYRRRLLRLEPRAHPPYRRGRAGAPEASVVAQQLSTGSPGFHDPPPPPYRRGRAGAPEASVVAQQLPTGSRVFTTLPLAIDPDEVLRFQGYKKSVDTPGPEVLALFEEALAIGRILIAPRVVVRWLPVTRIGADTIEAGSVTLTIPNVERLWGSIEWLAAAVCTIGDG